MLEIHNYVFRQSIPVAWILEANGPVSIVIAETCTLYVV